MAYNPYKHVNAFSRLRLLPVSMEVRSPLGQTKYSILLLLLGGETTADDLASRLGMNLSVVRRHLEDMLIEKQVDASFRIKGSGRPSKHYSITLEGRGRISAKYDLLLNILTMAMTESIGTEKTKAIFASAARMLTENAGRRENINSVLPVLSDLGFEPELRKEGREDLIISKNCPFAKLAMEYPELACDTLHTVFLREVLERPNITLRQTIARGATECIHEA
jgi:predicted ArsR family transcriptional regulator